ncbi:phage portal protein [Clostridium botulinum]|uniref:phage portal protein n=1 Tax=Clostridium botulinum TaxID=1491 RepID=UPI0013F96CE6|nr:phage portal protein [Clostridium botulinum]MCD3217474.1 phage portal protein [Clostridium botulinum C]NFV47545.1 phage portal protein [Clostridium botulinum]
MLDADIRKKLLCFTAKDVEERKQALKYLLFYLGACNNVDSVMDKDLMGQSWLNPDNLDYIPAQVIDNKVKALISKQARFMFGQKPNLLFKSISGDREKCEELRQFVDSILNSNEFWSVTLKAFKLATITKKVLLRIEANEGKPIKIFYHNINDFKYEIDPLDARKLNKIIIVRKSSNELWKRYTYFLKIDTQGIEKCYLKTEIFGSDLSKPLDVKIDDTKLNKMPCWLIVNEKGVSDVNGISDIEDLISLQNEINRKTSDFSDALKFDMFGQTAIIDGTEDSVNKSKIAPNALLPVVSIEGKKAEVKKVESTFQNAEAVEKFLKRMENSMYEKLSIPRPEQIKNIPSAKTLKYIYSELVARCSEKWNDWEPAIRHMIRFIISACAKFNCYNNWDHSWDELLFNIVIKKNYPIPEDEDDKKRLAMEEVRLNVKSHKSYIKDFTDDEDAENIFKEICEEVTDLIAAENEQFSGNDEDE